MKRILLLLAVSFALANVMSDYKFSPRTERRDLSGITIYDEFIEDMKSGVVKKTTMDMGGFYELLDTESETISFNREDGRLVLSYSSRLPVVFWSWPPPNYYDSDRYYYKLGDEWYYDRFDNYIDNVKTDYLRFPQEMLSECEILEDTVTQVKRGYDIRIVTAPADSPKRNIITMKSDLNLVIREVEVAVVEGPQENAPVERRYRIRYKHVNEDIDVPKPEGLETRI